MQVRKPQGKVFRATLKLLEWLFLVVTSPAWLMFIAIFVAVFGAQWFKRKTLGPRRKWERWFAWHPVRINDNTFGPMHWMEVVERRSWDSTSVIQYRFPGDDNSDWDRARRHAEIEDAERESYWAARRNPTP